MSRVVTPSMIRKLNERQVFMAIQKYGPISRLGICERTDISLRAVIRMVNSLEKKGLIERVDEETANRLVGRPVVFYRIATTDVVLFGAVFERTSCWIFSARLGGPKFTDDIKGMIYKSSYESLLDNMYERLEDVRGYHQGERVLGLMAVVPGMIDNEKQEVIDAPTVPYLNGHRPGVDLASRFGLESLLVRDIDALCMAEQFWGNAQGLENFAVVDIEHAFNVAVVQNGRPLEEKDGMIAQFCNIRTNLLPGSDDSSDSQERITESVVATDVLRRIARRFDIPLDTKMYGEFIHELPALLRGGKWRDLEFNETVNIDKEIDSLIAHLAVVLELMIYAFNPSVLFVRIGVLNERGGLLEKLIVDVRNRLPNGLYDHCNILQTSHDENAGAVALYIKYLADRIGPEVQR